MKQLKYLIITLCLIINLVDGGIVSLETKANGKHISIKPSSISSSTFSILSHQDRLQLINHPEQFLKMNTDLLQNFPISPNSEIDQEILWSHVQKTPFMFFSECTAPDCPLTRSINPKPRRLFEQKVLHEAVNIGNKKTRMHLVFFGSNYFYDTLVHLAQILESLPKPENLEISLIDSMYGEYIEYIKQHNLNEVPMLEFTEKDKQNWYNLLTVRFALFSLAVEKMAPSTKVSICVYSSLSYLAQDLEEGVVKNTADLVIAGDLFDPGGGAYALHDLIVHGATVTNKNSVLLNLNRDDFSKRQSYHIGMFKKQTMATESRKGLEKIYYKKEDNKYDKMGKRLTWAETQFDIFIDSKKMN